MLKLSGRDMILTCGAALIAAVQIAGATASRAEDTQLAAVPSDRPLGVLLRPIDQITFSRASEGTPQPAETVPASADQRPLGVLFGDPAGNQTPPATNAPPRPMPNIGAGFHTPPAAAPAPAPTQPAAAGRPLGLLIAPTAFDGPSGPATTAPQPVAAPAPAPVAPTPVAPTRAAPGASSARPLGTLIFPEAPPVRPAEPVTAPAAPVDPSADTAPQPADQETPVHLTADEMTFDDQRNIVTAIGNVEVRYADRTLKADRIAYDRGANVVVATGHVTLIEPSGERIFGERMDISGDMKDAVVQNIGIILQDRSRIAGTGARRSGGRVTEMRKAVYSPCNLCDEDPSAPPLWRIKAVKVIHDKNAQIVEYRDAWLEVMGLPVAYTPYFRHPDPTVKRKSGFLFPKFGSSTDFGAILETPYFWNISPHQDATITPILMSSETPVLAVEYRNFLDDGELKFNGSVTDNSGDDEFDTEAGELGMRGHIMAEGRFDIDETWRWGFDLERSTDDTYMRRYGFPSPSSLNSQIFAEGFRKRNYFSARALAFQGLSSDDVQDETPIILPLLEFNHMGRKDRFGGRTSFDASLLAMTRNIGTDTRRLSLHPRWERPFVSPLGDVYRVSLGINTDVYHVNSLVRGGTKSNFSGVSHRASPYAALDWRMPFVRGDDLISQTIEPIASISWRPNGGNPDDIPNEDSSDLEFDETNLFAINRFSGLDRVEGGAKLSYGMKWGVFGKRGGSSSFFIGQSYRFRSDDTFAPGSGLEDNFSDFVSKVEISPNSNFNLLYRTRFSSENFSPNRNEVQMSAGVPAFRVSGNYVFLDQQEDSEFDGREELSTNVTSQFNRFWRGGLRAVRDMDSSEMRSIGVDLTYENECVVFTGQITRTFFEDRDLKPTDAITFHVTLKTIGEIQTGFSRSGN